MKYADTDAIRLALEKGFETNLFEAALRNLEDKTNPLRFNNFAYAVREVVRHVVKRLAPDADVVRCAWYTNQTDRNGGITRRQRTYYAVQGGLSDEFVKDFLELDTDAIHATLVKATDALNKFTHVEPETFQIPDAEVDRRVDHTLCALRDLLATISDCRRRIVERLEGEIDAAAAEHVLSDPLIGVDALASHFSVEEVSVSSVKVTGIDYERIYISRPMVPSTAFCSSGQTRTCDGMKARRFLNRSSSGRNYFAQSTNRMSSFCPKTELEPVKPLLDGSNSAFRRVSRTV